MGIWRDDVEQALRNLGRYSHLSEIYEEVSQVRSGNLPDTWQAIVRRELEYNSSDSASYQNKHDLFFSVSGLGQGIWGLRSDEPVTPIAVDIKDSAQPKKSKQEAYRILRDTKLARIIKKLHGDRCQICGDTVELSEDQTYSEAHHVRPLGAPHDGPDIAANIIVLCPNHHVMCDYGAIRLTLDALHLHPHHVISSEYVAYHNEIVLQGEQT